ncbi:unnamed protein product [Effrenium voratum]|uniref:Inositol-pentakisphosphate 2-kinase n=1 Tax=Effrenium voratum TaxID=2562239 RepID=A0AA36HRZ5_9DINO|nr:unnamed protein product [Effrenium voratum]
MKGIQALAFVRWKQSRFREALPLFHEMEQHLGKSAALCENIAHTYNSLGDFEKAEDYLRQALKFIEQEAGMNKGNRGGVLLGLGIVRDRLGKQKEALPVCLKAYEFYKERANGAPASLQAKAGISCAKIYAKLGDQKKAESYIREAVEMYEITCGETSPLTASAYHELGKVLWAQRRREDAQKWEYVNEGGANMVLRYVGSEPCFRGHVLRLRKGESTNNQDGYMACGSVVEISADMAARIQVDETLRSARPDDRLGSRGLDAGGAVLAALCPDLTFCPSGGTFEIKPKLGVADCGVRECGVEAVPRFTLLQCIDFPKKKSSLSKYNPIEFFSAILCNDKKRLQREIVHLTQASADPRQNNFRCLSGDMTAVTDAALDDLCEVLLRARPLLSKLRALDLLAAGLEVEDLVAEVYEAAGAPAHLAAADFQEALTEVGGLLTRLEGTKADSEGMRLVHEAYKDLRPELILALFLLGRTFHDASIIVNVRRCQTEESHVGLGYFQADEAEELWGRVSVIDTDIKPAHRIPDYARTLRKYCQHERVQPFLSCLRAGGTLQEGLDSVRTFGERVCPDGGTPKV